MSQTNPNPTQALSNELNKLDEIRNILSEKLLEPVNLALCIQYLVDEVEKIKNQPHFHHESSCRKCGTARSIPDAEDDQIEENNALPLSEFVESVGGRRGSLLPYAAKICLMYVFAGAPKTAEFINSKLGSKYSPQPIIDLVKKVTAGEVVLTNKQMIDATKEDPRLMQFITPFLPEMTGEYFNGSLLPRMNTRTRKA